MCRLSKKVFEVATVIFEQLANVILCKVATLIAKRVATLIVFVFFRKL